MSPQQDRIDLVPRQDGWDRLDDSGIRFFSPDRHRDQFLGPTEGAGHDSVLHPQIGHAQGTQLHGHVSQLVARPVSPGDQSLDRVVEGLRDSNKLVESGPPLPQLEVRDLGLRQRTAHGKLGLAQPPLESGVTAGAHPDSRARMIPYVSAARHFPRGIKPRVARPPHNSPLYGRFRPVCDTGLSVVGRAEVPIEALTS